MANACNATGKAPVVIEQFWGPMVKIPQGETVELFSSLGAEDLVQCRRVSTLWNKFAGDDFFWKNLFPTVPFPPKERAVAFIDRCAVTSKHGIEESIKSAASWVSLDELCKWKCIFSNNPESYLEAHFVCGHASGEEEWREYNKTCIFMKKLGHPESEMESFQDVKQSTTRVQKFYYPGGDVDLSEMVQVRMNLPKGEESENRQFFTRIIDVLNKKVTELENKVRLELTVQYI